MVCVRSSARRTPGLLRACAMFGIRLSPGGVRRGRLEAEARDLLAALRGGEVGLIAGPSGAGKTTLLHAVGRCARGEAGGGRGGNCRVIVARAVQGGAACSALDAISRVRPPGGLRGALGCLAAAGLADALVLPRVVGELSEGQRGRLALAVAMARAERELARGRDVVVLVDEFASMLDRGSAMSLAVTVAKWVRRHACRERLRVVAASGHEDVRGWLRAHVVAEVSAAGTVRMARCEGV